MKHSFKKISTNSLIAVYLFIAIFSLAACQKAPDQVPHPQPASFSSDVLDKWMTLQLRLMRNTTGVPNHGFSRHLAYSGIAALESIAPGLPAHQQWTGRWNGLLGLPVPPPSANYYYPANVNAALATMNRLFFPHATAQDKAAIDSLENALTQEFLLTKKASLINASADFGKAVADVVYNWALGDQAANANAPYTLPVGPGVWKPTPPAMSAPATPYWGNNRPVVSGSTAGTQVTAPPPYATTPGSAFYTMVSQVYNLSENLTEDQKAMAIFWRDVPGATSPGHWLSILQQVIHKNKTSLAKGVIAYALMGAAINDALIACFHEKYRLNLVRPITYIREVMGHSNWNSFIGTPAHPEYPSAHASLSGAAAEVLERLFDVHGVFTDHTYDYMGMPPRSYSNYTAIGAEAGLSRLFAGIHYQQSITAGIAQGKKVTENIFSPNQQNH